MYTYIVLVLYSAYIHIIHTHMYTYIVLVLYSAYIHIIHTYVHIHCFSIVQCNFFLSEFEDMDTSLNRTAFVWPQICIVCCCFLSYVHTDNSKLRTPPKNQTVWIREVRLYLLTSCSSFLFPLLPCKLQFSIHYYSLHF